MFGDVYCALSRAVEMTSLESNSHGSKDLLCDGGVDDSEHDVMAEEISILSLLYAN